MPNIKETYDVVVVGAGHAGCEAALASAKTWTRNHYIYSGCREYSNDAL